MQTFIGVDVGGSHITAAPVSIPNGHIKKRHEHRAEVNPHTNANEVLSSWALTIAKAIGNASLSTCQVCIAMPGPFDYEQGICLMRQVNKYDALYGLNIRQELAHRLALSPQQITFKNDAEAFLEGEMRFGAGQFFQKGLGITLGTGLGTALFEHQYARDLGLGIVHPLHEGVAEDYISTRWFLKRYYHLSNKSVTGVKEIAARYHTDPYAKQVFDEFAQHLSTVILDFIRLFQPEVVVFGGNIAQTTELFFPAIEQQLAAIGASVVLKKTALHEHASLIGAVSCTALYLS